jgi:hypothetical protein
MYFLFYHHCCAA